MVTTIRKSTGGDHPFYEFACLSTDTKPTSLVPENSLCREIDTGKMFYFSGGAWHEAPARGGSGEGGELPENFPTEDAANANKFLGFDNSGDYAALDAPSGAEKFVVTLTEDDSGAETVWTADTTLEEIVEADAAGKIVVAKALIDKNDIELEFAKTAVHSVEDDGTTMSAAVFSAQLVDDDDEATFYSIIGHTQDDEDVWAVFKAYCQDELPTYTPSNNGQVLGVSSGSLAWVDNYAPLIVTMTEDSQTQGTFVGDKTFSECKAAFEAGRNVVASIAGAMSTAVVSVSVSGSTIELVCGASGLELSGTENEYPSYTMH